MKLLLLSILIITGTSCSHLSSVSQTSIPKDKSKVVEARVENNIIFLFNFNNDYVDGLTQSLMNQCPNGSVKGILTKDENITYFPMVFHKNVVTAKGYCVKGKKKHNNKRRRK